MTPAALARRKAMANVGHVRQRTVQRRSTTSACTTAASRAACAGIVARCSTATASASSQTPNEVVISYEMIHDTRVIPLDNRPHIASSIKQYMGDARGRWEGDTLVVETTNFTDKTSFCGGLHSEQLKLTEWFTRIDPGDDRLPHPRRGSGDAGPAPFTVRLTITQQPNYQLYRVLVPRGQRRRRLRA